MKKALLKLAKQIEAALNYETPENDNLDDLLKCNPEHGMRVGWYYKEDADFWKEEKVEPREYTQYSGLLVLRPDAENRCGYQEIEDLVLIIDHYPCEKCYPEVDYIALAAFLDTPDLVEIFEQKKL